MLSLAACGPLDDESTVEVTGRILGGTDAIAPELDAVGELTVDLGDGPTPLCTAVLVAPTILLTAKHYALVGTFEGVRHYLHQLGPVGFRIGFDAARPVAIEGVAAADAADLDEGGIGFGADVAVLRLNEPVRDAHPIPIAPNPLVPERLGEELLVVGYGMRETPELARRRVSGQAVLASLGGITAAPLLAGYEALVTPGAKGAQPCHGDSGGPLLRRTDGGAFEVVGVASYAVAEGPGGTCSRGAVYAIFGPSVETLFERTGLTTPAPARPR